MEAAVTCALWLLALLPGCGRVRAFNLDTDNVLQRRGEADSLFGFSLAMHRQLEPQDKTMLLVGAPRAKRIGGQTSNVTGGVYSCDMSSPSAGCTRVFFDEGEDLTKESKQNQWLGVTVKSQGPGGKILACAHRYQRRSNVNTKIESRDIIGRCYVLSQNLKIDASSSEDGGDWHFCDSRPRGHEMFGSCQQGLSATFDKDFHYLIFGAPGAYNWKGVVRVEQKNETLLLLGYYDDGPFEAGDEREKNPDLVISPPNSYMGFALDSGKYLTERGELIVVAGAPRADHSGAVMLLKKSPPPGNNLIELHRLVGEGLASSFGYDVTVLDLNGDGWQDIVVGAPQYFEKNGKIGGAVYVYVNKAGKWANVKPKRIEGAPDSMFGLAVENLGDLNLDGYQDFAVGAPYEDDGAGKVYIYSGSSKGLASETPTQVLSSPVKLFGYSLAGNMDLDKNSYPDLAVGSLSDSVFVYKARPVIQIKKEVKFTPKEIDFTKKNCDRGFCLDVEACFTYTANPVTYSPKTTVTYSLEADSDNRKDGLNSRAIFIDPSTNEKLYTTKGTITLNTKGTKQCIKRQLAIPENIRDKLRVIPVDVSVDIQEAKRKRRQSAGPLTPVLDANEPKMTRAELHFLKEGCGSDNVCQSKLKVDYRYGHWSSDSDTFVPLQLENNVPLLALSDQTHIVLEVRVTNAGGDDAHEAVLNASIPRSLTYSSYSVPPSERQVSCKANEEGSFLECDLGNPFRRDAETTVYIILGTAGISHNTTQLEVDLQLGTTSNQTIAPVKAKANVASMLLLTVSGQIHPSQVYFMGEGKRDSTLKSESDIGSAITHQFKILNLGRRLTDVGSVSLNIHWPKFTDKRKPLLYLMEISSTGVDQLQCSPENEINSLNLEASRSKRRTARSTRGSQEGTISRFIDSKKLITLSCDSGAKCVTVKCPLRGLDSSAVVTVHSRLWNKTFTEDYSKMHHVEVIVHASLQVDSTMKNTLPQNSETQVKMTVFPERREAHYGGVPWWIIFLSILFALLLLGLLAFLLWKCGFFKRAKNADEVPSYNAVRIKREERAINAGHGKWEKLEKKPWMTTWHDDVR